MPEKPITIERIIPGAFYHCVQPGHYTDPTTGICIPGPIVKIDPVTRAVAEVSSMPDPVQIPKLKRTFDIKDPKVQVDAAFDRVDAEATCEGLNMALATGVIRRVEDEEVAELYPAAWAKRDDHKVFNPNANSAVPMATLVDQYQAKVRAAKAGVKTRESQAAEALGEVTAAPARRRGRPRKPAEETTEATA